MIKLYKRIISNCKTINQINRVHISLENWMTPLNWHQLREELLATQHTSISGNKIPEGLDELSLAQYKWVASMERVFQRGLKMEAQPFERIRLRRHVALFSDKSQNLSEKTLIVCFTGMSQRMMTPLAAFLQNFDSKESDVALITYPKGKGFRNGLEGTADSFEKMIDALSTLFASLGYRRIVAMGVSGGGIPAILCALRAGWYSALIFGAGSPKDPRWFEALGFDVSDFFKRNTHNLPNPMRLYLVYGADSIVDYEAAKAIQKLLPASLIKVAGKSEPIGHVVLHPLLMSGQLVNLINKTLLGPNINIELKENLTGTKKTATVHEHTKNMGRRITLDKSLQILDGPRVVCVGFNKTGTTTLGRCFEILGITPIAEPRSPYMDYISLSKEIFELNDYDSVLSKAQYFRAFQDRPWNIGIMYQKLDARYPGSKFILTEREPESWWESVNKWLLKSHKGDTDRLQRYLHHLKIDRLDKDLFIQKYQAHNAAIKHYFVARDNLLIMNLAAGDGWGKLCSFLELPVPDKPFPHANKQRSL
jgi:hypothetical protein